MVLHWDLSHEETQAGSSKGTAIGPWDLGQAPGAIPRYSRPRCVVRHFMGYVLEHPMRYGFPVVDTDGARSVGQHGNIDHPVWAAACILFFDVW